MIKDAILSARIPASLKEALERGAFEDQRSLASYVTKALTDYAVSKGLLPPTRPSDRNSSKAGRPKRPERRA